MRTLGLVLVSLFIFGCSHAPKPEPEGYSPSGFWKAQAKRRETLSKVTATLSLSYRGVQQGAGKVQMIGAQPDRFRMEVRDSIGRVHLIAGLLKNSFVALYPRQRKVHQDNKAGRSYLMKVVGFEYSFKELFPLMFGELPKDTVAKGFKTWQWDGKVAQYRAELADKRFPWVVWVDPAAESAITKIESQEGQKKFLVEYLEFSRCCGGSEVGKKDEHFQLAQSMTLTDASGARSLDVRWKEINPVSINWPDKAFNVAVPKNTAPLE